MYLLVYLDWIPISQIFQDAVFIKKIFLEYIENKQSPVQ